MREGEKVQVLEERVAFLERHVELQDAEMLEQMRVLRRLVERVEMLEGRVRDGAMGGEGLADERPPHY
jgi:uncharacterized coiled-coil protein SlyX